MIRLAELGRGDRFVTATGMRGRVVRRCGSGMTVYYRRHKSRRRDGRPCSAWALPACYCTHSAEVLVERIGRREDR